ncbi:glycosyl transferase [Idiomarina loihiensis]|uniref:glycosyltransferase family protein n=2 Tax=Idiomarinaceae TaxID=267893 RepID=UPI0002D8EAE6|nr:MULTISPECIES: glycosyltransferase family protein [Idiomarina]MRJ45388.1 glycosyl transferase [Idiomarina loihiensis]NWO03264.1 glycosyl transferase [Idiomarinaceae bacterium]UTW33487.1 glycosyl transferase [Idiomarina loihiensis]|tara:strand:+ start:10235 stop:11266 length:1032 start_codon:yes stop_codon:yes gene_type:complete
MKILYGIQGTGNGHLSRCHTMAKSLAKYNVDIDYLISGRDVAGLFDMDVFGDYQWQQGLSFVTEKGRLRRRKTLLNNDWSQFWQDVKKLPVKDYDLVITDYEPVTAWAAKKAGVRCIGLGRQYAFQEPELFRRLSWWQKKLISSFAPCSEPVGMHWLSTGNAIPPVVRHEENNCGGLMQRVVVYLPFEDPRHVIEQLQPLDNYEFSFFHPLAKRESLGHIECYPPSRAEFAAHFNKASAILSNAGFETSCEALSQGKALAVKPLTGQFEQKWNAQILQEQGLAHVLKRIDSVSIDSWLTQRNPQRLYWPNVADELAQWISKGAQQPVAELSAGLWSRNEKTAV